MEENFCSIYYEGGMLGRRCIIESIYNPFGLVWQTDHFEDINPIKFKELSAKL